MIKKGISSIATIIPEDEKKNTKVFTESTKYIKLIMFCLHE